MPGAAATAVAQIADRVGSQEPNEALSRRQLELLAKGLTNDELGGWSSTGGRA